MSMNPGSTDSPSGTPPAPREYDEADMKLAEISFKTVLDADIHQDNKANRILAAMAFLTAAAAQIFARASTASTSGSAPTLAIAGLTINVPLIAFSVYMFLVLSGVLIYLNALGPSFNIPSHFRAHAASPVRSLLFFDKIAELERDNWLNHWSSGSTQQLRHQMAQSFLFETHLIAEKTKTKVFFMSIGSRLFRSAIPFLSPLIGSMFSQEPKWFWFSILLGFSVWIWIFTLDALRPYQDRRKSFPIWLILAILSLLGVIIFPWVV